MNANFAPYFKPEYAVPSIYLTNTISFGSCSFEFDNPFFSFTLKITINLLLK